MFNSMDQSIRLTLPTSMGLSEVDFPRPNFTLYLTDAEMDDVSRIADPDYEQFLADVWVGIVLTLLVLSCVCCMCSCLLYHKFQQWKRSLLDARRSNNVESGQTNDTESLPSYTVVSGLPSYDEAIEQLRQVNTQTKNDLIVEIKTLNRSNSTESWVPHTPPLPTTRLSVTDLFQLYKNNSTTVPSVDCKS